METLKAGSRQEMYFQNMIDALNNDSPTYSLTPVWTNPEAWYQAIIDAIYANKIDPDDLQAAVDAVLEDHPEWTTTVQDGSITDAKFNSSAIITNAQIDALFS